MLFKIANIFWKKRGPGPEKFFVNCEINFLTQNIIKLLSDVANLFLGVPVFQDGNHPPPPPLLTGTITYQRRAEFCKLGLLQEYEKKFRFYSMTPKICSTSGGRD